MKHLVTLSILVLIGFVLGASHALRLDFHTSRVVCAWILVALSIYCTLTYWVYCIRVFVLPVCGILIYIGLWPAFDHWGLTDPVAQWYSSLPQRFLGLALVIVCCFALGKLWDDH
jgi:hypothetical protein